MQTFVALSSLSEGARFTTEGGRRGTLTRRGNQSCGVLWEKRERNTLAGVETEAAHHLDIAPGTQVVQVMEPLQDAINAK